MYSIDYEDGERETIPPSSELVRTYSQPGYGDPWDVVGDYRRVVQVSADNPNKGSAAIASRVDLPRSRIRGWVDGDTQPDPVRALETAEIRGWLVDLDDLDGDRGQALAGLVAWVLAGGSLSVDDYRPTFVVDRDVARPVLFEHADAFGVDLREFSREEGEQSRAVEWRPAEDAPVLGRVLAAAGAPIGNAGDDLEVPEWIREGPDPVRQAFVETYLVNRGTTQGEDRDLLAWRTTNRPERFLKQVAEMIVEQAGAGSYTTDGKNVRFDREATEALLGQFDRVDSAVR